MSQHVKSVIAELDAGKVPNHLWNKYMSLAREGEGAPVNSTTNKPADPVEKPAVADQAATQQPDAPASVPEEAAEVPKAEVSEPEDST